MKTTFAMLGLGLVLTACGGGSDTPEPPAPPPTNLPATVSIAASGVAQTATSVQFKHSISNAAGLSFRWDLGDGAAAVSDATPSHVFAKPGSYKVSLVVSDAAGASRNASFELVVSDKALVQGLQCSAANTAGWCWSSAMTGDGDRINNAVFLDAAQAWAAGDAGHVYKTEDGGKSWISKLKLNDDSVVHVAAADALRVWALSRSGKIMGSADGGANWRALPRGFASIPGRVFTWRLKAFDAKRLLIDMDPSGSMPAWRWSADGGESWADLGENIVARHGEVFWGTASRSEDGGRSFHPYTLPALSAGEQYQGLSAVDAQVAVQTVWKVAGQANLSSEAVAFVRTSDGGKSWQRREIPSDGPRQRWANSSSSVGTQIMAASADQLWASTGSSVARSIDGGLTWTRHPIPQLPAGRLNVGEADSSAPKSFTVTLSEGEQFDGQQALYRTLDAGASWKRMAPAAFGPQRLASYQSLGAQTLLWSSEGGALFRSDDGGTSWKLLAGLGQASAAIRSIAFWDGQHGLAFRDDGHLLITADSGRSWQPDASGQPVPGSALTHTVQLFGGQGWMLRNGALLFSEDRGRTWTAGRGPTTGLVDSRLLGAHFLDAKRGVALDRDASTFRTSDGGITWRKLDGRLGLQPGRIAGISFSDENNGLLIMRGDQLMVTSDGGNSWLGAAVAPGVKIHDAKLVDGLNGWAVGAGPDTDGVLYRSQDGGKSWTLQALPARPYTGPFRAIHFKDSSLGWLVGDRGVIYASKDGGNSWTRQAIGSSRDLSAVHFFSSTTGWIGGAQGEFLLTGTGGN